MQLLEQRVVKPNFCQVKTTLVKRQNGYSDPSPLLLRTKQQFSKMYWIMSHFFLHFHLYFFPGLAQTWSVFYFFRCQIRHELQLGNKWTKTKTYWNKTLNSTEYFLVQFCSLFLSSTLWRTPRSNMTNTSTRTGEWPLDGCWQCPH